MIDMVEDYAERYTIVRGFCDIILTDNGYVITNNDYWVVLGNLPDDAILESFEWFDVNVDRPGCYEYKACIYYQSSTWDEPGDLYIDYIDLVFVETFESRIRESKLNDLLGSDSLFDF